MMESVPMPPPILFMAREPLVAGRENEYRKIEVETARLSAKLGCPHPETSRNPSALSTHIP